MHTHTHTHTFLSYLDHILFAFLIYLTIHSGVSVRPLGKEGDKLAYLVIRIE